MPEPGAGLRWEDEFPALLATLEKRAREAPDLFSAEVLAQIMATASYLFLRTKLRLEYDINSSDVRGRYHNGPYLAEGVTNVLIPRLLEIGQHCAEIVHIQAATARQWSLARAKELQSGSQQRKQKKTPARRRPTTNGKPKPTAKRSNGTAAPHLNGNRNRIAAFLQ